MRNFEGAGYDHDNRSWHAGHGRRRRQHKELIRQERVIARKYMGNFPLAMAIWGLGNLVCWLALWPLVFAGILPLWAAFPIATLNVILCYLPSHEAQHSNFGRPGDRF